MRFSGSPRVLIFNTAPTSRRMLKRISVTVSRAFAHLVRFIQPLGRDRGHFPSLCKIALQWNHARTGADEYTRGPEHFLDSFGELSAYSIRQDFGCRRLVREFRG